MRPSSGTHRPSAACKCQARQTRRCSVTTASSRLVRSGAFTTCRPCSTGALITSCWIRCIRLHAECTVDCIPHQHADCVPHHQLTYPECLPECMLIASLIRCSTLPTYPPSGRWAISSPTAKRLCFHASSSCFRWGSLYVQERLSEPDCATDQRCGCVGRSLCMASC